MKKQWVKVYKDLKEHIENRDLSPGSNFPSNKKLQEMYGINSLVTIQTAVNELIKEGLVINQGKRNNQRIVTPFKNRIRSNRKGDFTYEFNDAIEQVIEKKLFTKKEDLLHSRPKNPSEFLHLMSLSDKLPVLYLRSKLIIHDIVVGIAESYFPSKVDVRKLDNALPEENPLIYMELKQLGTKPKVCQELLRASIIKNEESALMNIREDSGLPCVRIIRKVNDEDGDLVQLCFIVNRADTYEYEYTFDLFEDSSTK